MPPIKAKFSFTEKYLTRQFTPLYVVRGFHWLKNLMKGIPALRNQDSRRFFFGQLISNIGSWMQTIALGWLTYDISQSAFLVGLTAAAGSIPTLVLSLFGGTLVDGLPKKNVLMASHIASATLAFTIGILAYAGLLNIPYIIFFSFLTGIINSIYTPAHYSFISEIVNKKYISSAISINASVSSLGRVIGPVLGGLYIKYFDVSGTFILNGLSYLAVIFALALINKRPKTNIHKLHPIAAIKAGISYCFSNPMIKATLIYTSINSIFALSYLTIIPVIIKDLYNSDSVGLGNFHTSIGLGAITATIISTILTNRLSKFSLFFAGNTIFALSLLGITFSNTLDIGTILAFTTGAGIALVTIMLSIIAMDYADTEYRGRVSSTYYMAIGGIGFLGNLEVGYLSEKIGTITTLRLNSLIILLSGLYVATIINNLRKSQKAYTQRTNSSY